MRNFSEEEIADRQKLVKPIVQAAQAIRNFVLSPEKISELAVHWEVALSNVPTNQLDTVYRLGLEKRCTTAEQFAMIWDMKVEALAMRAQHRRQQEAAKAKAVGSPIPPHILASWTSKGSK